MSTDLEREIINDQLQQSLDDINRVFESVVGKQDRRTLDETVFVNEFLPYLSGQKNLSENMEIISYWLQIAGTPFAEVDLVNRAGEKVLTVPGLSNTMAINIANSGTKTFGDIVKQADVVGSQQRVFGTRYLREELENKRTQLLNNESSADDITKDRWSNIFQHYGIEQQQRQQQQQTNKEQLLDDNVEYE